MELSYSEAQNIISGSDPRSPQYHNNSNPDLSAAVTAAFQRQFPGEVDLSDSTPEALRKAGDPGDQAGADRSEAEDAAKIAGYLGMTPGGPELDAFRQEAHEYVTESFASFDDFQAVAASVELQIGPEKAVKLLRDAMKGRHK